MSESYTIASISSGPRGYFTKVARSNWQSNVSITRHEIKDSVTNSRLLLSRISFGEEFQREQGKTISIFYTKKEIIDRLTRFLKQNTYVADILVKYTISDRRIIKYKNKYLYMDRELGREFGNKYWLPWFYQTFHYPLYEK